MIRCFDKSVIVCLCVMHYFKLCFTLKNCSYLETALSFHFYSNEMRKPLLVYMVMLICSL